MNDSIYSLDSVGRALDVLEFLASQGGSGRVTDIARAINSSKNTAFRILKTLEERDYVRQAGDLSYELTFKLLTLGESVLHNTDLHAIARPILEALAKDFGETVSLGILDGKDIVYLDRVLGNQPYHTAFSVGSKARPYSTSLGKSILAFSPIELLEDIVKEGLRPVTECTITNPDQLRAELVETASRGYAVDNQENVLGIRCVGVPIFDRKGVATAAISVSGLAVRMTDDRISVIAESLLSGAANISTKLGYSAAELHAQARRIVPFPATTLDGKV